MRRIYFNYVLMFILINNKDLKHCFKKNYQLE